jgi:transcriptional regulator with XRE-family HTH domain
MGRHPGISSTEEAFRRAFALELRKVIGDGRGGASRAAEKLRVSRQAISLYLKEQATPSAEIVRRACKEWSLSLNIEGNLVSQGSYRDPAAGPAPAPPLQLSLLPDALDSLKDENVKVKIAKKLGEAIHLEVRIDFAR